MKPLTSDLSVLFAAVLVLCSGGTGAAQTAEQAMAELAEKLTGAGNLAGHQVAVGDFEEGRGRYTRLSPYLSDLIGVELVNRQTAQSFVVIQREQRTEAQKELKFGLSDMADSEKKIEVGRLLSATAIVAGSITDQQTHLHVIGRLVELSSSRVLAAHPVKILKTDAMRALMAKPLELASEAAPSSTAPEGQLRVAVRMDKTVFRVGEEVRFRFTTNRDAYVTLVDHATSGQTIVLYPNAYSGGNLAKAGVEYTIPGPADGFVFRVQRPTGIEFVHVVATDRPWSPGLAAAERGVRFRSLSSDETRALTRDIATMQKTTAPTQRDEAIVRVEIRD